jgi:hypothetical protein
MQLMPRGQTVQQKMMTGKERYILLRKYLTKERQVGGKATVEQCWDEVGK